jgi:hypothetical protein
LFGAGRHDDLHAKTMLHQTTDQSCRFVGGNSTGHANYDFVVRQEDRSDNVDYRCSITAVRLPLFDYRCSITAVQI